MVMACPIPLCGLSGATTTTLPRSFTASTKALMPGEVMPSSFVIRITGFAEVLVIFFAAFFAFAMLFKLLYKCEDNYPAKKILQNIIWLN
jgi:hypothetical protein